MSRVSKPVEDRSERAGGRPWQNGELIKGVGSAIVRELAHFGRDATVKSVRFVPSTVSRRSNGDIEMIANTTIEGKSGAEVLESVVTIGPDGVHPLKTVRTHSLWRREHL